MCRRGTLGRSPDVDRPLPSQSGVTDALARDSDVLSQVLHEVLVEQCGDGLARTVGWLHESAAELRNGDAGAGAALVELVHNLPQDEIEPCIGRARCSSGSRTSPRSASASAAGATTT